MSLRREPSSPSLRRIRTTSALLALVVALASFVALPSSPAGADEVGTWLSTINTFRQAKGLTPFTLDGNLSSLATQQAQRNASAGALAHTPNLAAGVTSNWGKLGENVGMGLTTDIIWQAFLNSPPHLANLMDPGFTHIGIGVVYGGNAQWVVHRFMGLAGPPVVVEVPVTEAPVVVAPPVTAPPATRPPTTVAPAPVTTLPRPTTTTTTAPPPAPVVVPAASAPDRAAALLDALHRIE